MKEVYTTGQVAGICNVTIRTVIKWFESGRLKGYKIPGSKDRRIPHESLVEFMQQNGLPLKGLEGPGRRRILIADDDEAIVTLLGAQLSELGLFEVHSAASAYQAGLMTAQLRPHVLLLDYQFGDATGEEVAKMIRQNPDLATVKIIVMSAFLSDEEAARLLKEGVDDYLKKPFQFAELKERLLRVLALA